MDGGNVSAPQTFNVVVDRLRLGTLDSPLSRSTTF
jgi:hypothetical protein